MLSTLRAGIERNMHAREGRKSLTGRPCGSAPELLWPGSLPELYRAELRGPGIDYVILSYETPIAWRRADGSWRMPLVTYSLTTSGHQYLVRALLQDMLGPEWRERIDSSGPAISLRKGHGPEGLYGPRGDGTF